MDGEPVRSQPKPTGNRVKCKMRPIHFSVRNFGTKREHCPACAGERTVPALRKKRLRKKPPRRLSSPSADPGYLAFVRGLPCRFAAVADEVFFCHGTTEAHHAGKKPGMGMKAPDDTAVPLCQNHHVSWHCFVGPFFGMSKAERFAWSVVAIAETRAAYKLRTAGGANG